MLKSKEYRSKQQANGPMGQNIRTQAMPESKRVITPQCRQQVPSSNEASTLRSVDGERTEAPVYDKQTPKGMPLPRAYVEKSEL